MDNPIYVMMPVLCIGKVCKNCPNLKVDTEVSELASASDNWETRYETNLRCRGVNRCMRIKQMMEEHNEIST